MKLQIKTTDFRSLTAHAYGAVKASTTLPILGNLLLVAKDGKLTAMGCNLDLWAETSVPCEVIEEGSVTLNARKLVGIGKTVSADTITIEVDEQLNAKISGGEYESEIPGLASEEFPPVMQGEGERKAWVILSESLRSNLRRVEACASNDPTRYVLNGIYLEANKGSANWVATNGRILGYTSDDLAGPDASVILPSDFVTQAIRLLDLDDSAELVARDNCVTLTVGDSSVTSKLIEGYYPNYKNIVPNDFKGSAEIDRQSFLSALAQVSEVGTNAAGKCWPYLTFSKNNLSIMADAGERHVSKTSMTVKTSDALRIRFDKKYLDAILRNLPEDSVHFDWLDSMSALKITAGTFTGILMPLRTE